MTKLLSHIRKAHFIAFDFEFSGLLWHPQLNNSIVDTYSFRYWKHRESVRRFFPVQLGLTPCYFSDNTLTTYPYNFHLLPQKGPVHLNTGSLKFLASNGFDFNKWLEQAERYAPRESEQQGEGEQQSGQLSEAIKLITSLKKPIVGHNMIFDLLYLYSGFVGQLPEELSEFKLKVLQSFPALFDTKVMLQNSLSLGSKLGGFMGLQESAEAVLQDPLFNADQSPLISIHKKFKDKYSLQKGGKYHEAGYDSLMTAALFVKLCAFLQTDGKFKPELMRDGTMPKKEKRPAFNFNVVNQYRNKVVMGNLKTPLDLEDRAQEEGESRQNVYAVRNVPETVNSQELEEQLGKALGVETKFYRLYGNNVYFFTIADPEEQKKVEGGEEVQLGAGDSGDGRVKVERWEEYAAGLRARVQ